MKQPLLKKSVKKLAEEKNIKLINKQLENSKSILKIANLLIQNKFVYKRTWDMEPCHTPYEVNPIDWLANPNGDDEWTFMLNRFNYVEYLVMATIITGEIKFLKHAKHLVLHWIEVHSEIKPSFSTRTLDTGMRIDAWIDLMVYLDIFNLLSTEDFNQIESSIAKQIIYMKDHYIDKYTLSNWGSIQTATIIRILPMLSDFDRKKEIYRWAKDEFETQLRLQVYDDGLHWEQSTMYHAEVLHYSLKLVNIDGYVIADDIKNILYKMSEALLYQMTPTRAFEAFGDSDISNLVSLLNLSAVIFQEEKFKISDSELTNMDNLYEMTCSQIACYANLSSSLPQELNFDGYDSGMFTSRSSWGKKANFTLFTNGTMGSGHAHADNNHLSIYHHGEGIVVDSGRYTYREDDSQRIDLKSAESHSSVIIDGIAGSVPSGSWTFESYLKPIANRVKHKGDFHFYQGTTLSNVSPNFYVHTRKILVYDGGIWLIVDDVRSKGEHSIQTYFNLEPQVKLKLKENNILLNDLKFISLNEEYKINEHIYSPKYNQIKENKQIELESFFTDKSITTKLFMNREYDYQQVDILRDNKEIIKEDLGIAIKVNINKMHSVTFVIIHDELYDGRKNLVCEGVTIHAKAVAIEEKNNKKEIYVLST